MFAENTPAAPAAVVRTDAPAPETLPLGGRNPTIRANSGPVGPPTAGG